MFKKICAVLVVLGLLAGLVACKPLTNTPKPTTPTTTATTITTTTATPSSVISQTDWDALKKQVSNMQSQINVLQTSGLDKATVTDIQNKLTELTTDLATATTTANNALKAAGVANDNIAKITTTATSVQDLINTFTTAYGTVIGTTPMTINGLAVTFITNSVYVPTATATVPGWAQMAIKITNNNAYSIVNVDITGTITSSQYLPQYVAANYPTLIDGAGAVYYNAYFNGSNAINFETYSIGSAANAATLTIPKGGSITLRPKVGLLAATGLTLPGTMITASINTITYDIDK